jgi:excisionase family DNA binding protein
LENPNQKEWESERLLTPAEVAEWLQVSKKSIYDYCDSRRSKTFLPHVRVGGSLRFRRSDIAAWLESNVQRCA